MHRSSGAKALRHTLLLAILLAPASTFAQPRARVSLDSVTAIDFFKGQGDTERPDASVDIGLSIRLSDGWLAYVRPWFFQSAQGSDWDKEIYQAALQYQHAGPVATRVDLGYIASPIGLGMLDMRADINPTIRPHLSYFVPLMPFDGGTPSVGPIASSYPLGAQLSASTARWDARAALVNSTPTRKFALNADTPNPRATPAVIAGGGFTPRAGLRVGLAAAMGHYATAQEVSSVVAGDRKLTMWSIEGEYAVGYTKVAAEWTRERFAAGASRDAAATWFLQGTQTLSPRWFVAARHEGTSAPPFGGAATRGPRLTFKTVEAAVGFRVSPELTVRGSLFASKFYTRAEYDQQAGVSLVWSRRWW